MKDGKLDAVLPLTLQDFDRACILFRSLEIFFYDLGTLWIVTPDAEAQEISRRIAKYQRYQVIVESELVPEIKHYQGRIYRAFPSASAKIFGAQIAGWFMQQLIKLAIVERVKTDFYLTLDADVICVKPVCFSDLVRDGRTFSNRQAGEDYRPQWYEWSERVLGFPRSGSVHGATPAILSKEAALKLCEFLATKQNRVWRALAMILPDKLADVTSWRSYLLRNLPWTEYTLYYTFLEAMNLYADYHFHAEEERGTLYAENKSVWTSETGFDDWNPQEVFNNQDDFYFVVIQSNLSGVSTIDIWEKVRYYLTLDGQFVNPGKRIMA